MATTRAILAVAVAAAVAVTAGCDDGDTAETAATATTATTGADSEFCQLAQQLDEQEDFPSADQLAAYRAAAPAEIAGSVQTVVARFLAAIDAGDPTAPYADPEIEAAFAPIDEYETTVCGISERP